ncbi:hypothetical protein N7509_002576 [Penicillium cosmopolitanum]|uniref:NACHT domain-containing protein n=1 Tax=Penicillium cosmopolitanum TaxID=1131564 RepID=A0A9W9W9A4_9EURO|nr:uncharacterized protein N7509_002576 [Penicillium cosmopolitanum]KAJ5408693.1 hypothetical protein N7509_002576 [Penicillium cosmopolitanum]
MNQQTSFGDANCGSQVAQNHGSVADQNHGNITNHFHSGAVESESLSDTLCLRYLCTTNPRDGKKRIEETKGGLLKDSYRWIVDNEDYQSWHADTSVNLLWIKGDPGKGKTMLTCGIIDELERDIGDKANISFFFCQATDERINSAISVLRAFIYLITEKQPSLLSHVRKRYDQAGKQLFENMNTWQIWQSLTGILSDILVDPSLRRTYFLIDALDEYLTDMPKLLNFISGLSLPGSLAINWIVSGRNLPIIDEHLNCANEKIGLSLELNEKSVSEALAFYIDEKIQQLARKEMYSSDTREAVYQHLRANAHGTYLWVALVYEKLQKARSWKTLKLLTSFPPGLEPLYKQMLDRVQASEDADIFSEVLATVFTVYRPIGLEELFTLVDLPHDVNVGCLPELIKSCGSFLTLHGDRIFFVHQSAKDFLVDRASSLIFPSGAAAQHSLFCHTYYPFFSAHSDVTCMGPASLLQETNLTKRKFLIH